MICQAAEAALKAGKQRRVLAQSIAATSHGSGSSNSSGKRSVKDVKSTPSTRVTPEAKVPNTSDADAVEPRSLDFGDNDSMDTTGSVCECVGTIINCSVY